MRSFPRPVLWIGLLVLAGCNEGTSSPGTTSASLYLTDAPGDVEAVWVDILHAYVRGDGEQIDLLDGPTGLIELTALTDDVAPLAEGVELPAGRYKELRLVIGDAVLETMDGDVFSKDGTAHPDGLETTGTLHCPSCSQSGLKVKFAEQLELGEDGFVVVADFDVSQSFGKERGNSGRWVMHPVVHGTALGSGGEINGTVALGDGVTLPECPAGTPHALDFFVPTGTAQTLTDGEGLAIVRTGSTAPDGTFSLDFLAPDTYDMGFFEEVEVADHVLAFEAEVAPASALVSTGGSADGIAFTITSATCVPPA